MTKAEKNLIMKDLKSQMDTAIKDWRFEDAADGARLFHTPRMTRAYAPVAHTPRETSSSRGAIAKLRGSALPAERISELAVTQVKLRNAISPFFRIFQIGFCTIRDIADIPPHALRPQMPEFLVRCCVKCSIQ